MSLTPINSALNKLFELPYSSLQTKLDILDVVTGIRPAARLILHKKIESAQCIPLLLDLQLSISVGAACGLKQTAFNYIDNSNQDEDTQLHNFVRIYISTTKSQSEGAKQADFAISDADLGAQLGYPSCCIKFVIQRKSVPTVRESPSLYSLNGYYNPMAWPVAGLFDAGIVPHFPCSMSCNASHALAQSRLDAVRDEIQNGQYLKSLIHYNSIPYSKCISDMVKGSKKMIDSSNLLMPQYLLKSNSNDFR